MVILRFVGVSRCIDGFSNSRIIHLAYNDTYLTSRMSSAKPQSHRLQKSKTSMQGGMYVKHQPHPKSRNSPTTLNTKKFLLPIPPLHASEIRALTIITLEYIIVPLPTT